MMRTELPADAGMWFVFEENAPGRKFWMKNTLIPLDIMWADGSGSIVYIEEQVPPCEENPCPTYGPSGEVSRYVFEVNSGVVATL